MRLIILCSSVVLAGLFSTHIARGAEEVCTNCARKVLVSGQFNHAPARDGLTITGMPQGGEKPFLQEVFGTDFTLSVSDLDPGKYTMVIGLAETFFNHAGARVFDIACGNQTIASNLDIFAAAGGDGKVYFITNQVDFPGDAVHGPLTLAFTARVDNAKLNTFELRDASGKSVVSMCAADLVDPDLVAAMKLPVVTGPEIWKDVSQPIDARVNDLIGRMSLAEKVQQVRNATPAIPRLGIPAYDFWSEALHGVWGDDHSTVFPQPIGMAATWDAPLIHDEAAVIATEARAKHNDYTSKHNGDSSLSYGLTFWAPNINIFRDPRWGRGHETYGEDPFLTGQIAVQFIRGMQGDDPKYVKAMACAKHYAVHSGPEPERHRFDAEPPERDFYETYLPHFETAVRVGHVGGVMGSYNSVFGVPACASQLLLTDILREKWGFDGYIVSDCGAINDIFAHHKFVATPEEAAADAVKAGCDICCGDDYDALVRAVRKGLITESEIDGALAYALKTRFRLGMFDPPEQVAYARIPISQNDTPEHEALALKVSCESMVLLKNNGLLPLDRAKIKRIAVIGANANSVPVLRGNYNGTPARPVTILDGIKSVAGANIQVVYETGCPLALHKGGTDKPDAEMQTKAIEAARLSDVIIYVGGISPDLEGEEMRVDYDGFYGGDRTRIELPAVQTELLKALQATGKPVVFVNCSGSAIAMPWEARHLPAILQAWYPGEQGGRAVAEVLFGDVNPAGRLPITFYRATDELPAFENYSMSNRTYRYFGGHPLFAFGHGLSYTRFGYRNAKLDETKVSATGTLKLTFNLANTGSRDGDEVAQVYFRHVKSVVPQPKLALCGFERVHVQKGKTAKATMEIPVERFRYWDTDKKQYVIEPGGYELLLGTASDDIRSRLPLKVIAQR